jgi:hypothetical protein
MAALDRPLHPGKHIVVVVVAAAAVLADSRALSVFEGLVGRSGAGGRKAEWLDIDCWRPAGQTSAPLPDWTLADRHC